MLQFLRTLFILALVVGLTFGQKGGKNGKGSTTTLPPPSDLGSDPVPCNDEDPGHCECGDTSKGFQTYTFMVEDVQRCFTTYFPLVREGEILPLMITSNCYGKDTLGGIQMKKTNHAWNEAASQFGYARIGVSTPEGKWLFPNDMIINDEMPMPCSDSDSKDLIYMRKVFEFIQSNDNKFDLSRVYAHGFSQNSIWSSVIGVCFGDQVRGIFLGASGMSIKGQGLSTTSCGGYVSSSSRRKCKKEHIKGCEDCELEYPCDDCQYTPIYPCYTPKKPLIACLSDYKNDWTTNSRDDPDNISSIKNMYVAMFNEGHDARLFRFSPAADGSIKGSHKSPPNVELWQVGCLGLSTPCSKDCEDKVIECTENGDTSTAIIRTETFKSCMSADKLISFGCPSDCAPTFKMLASSQVPETFGDENGYFNFGDIEYSEYDSSQPESSLCNAEEQ